MSRILVVDDSSSLRSALARSLTLAGHAVTTAHDGQHALRELSHDRPDVILLDLSMPVMDGFTFLSLVRSTPDLAAIPILVVTGCTDPRDLQKAIDLGAKTCLSKATLTIAGLLEKITSHALASDAPLPADHQVPAPPERSTVRPKPSDLRANRRETFQIARRLLLLQNPWELLTVSTCDLALGGIGFECDRRLSIGDHLLFSFDADNKTILCRCRVQHCTDTGHGRYRIGAAFVQSLRQPKGSPQIPLDWLGLRFDSDGSLEVLLGRASTTTPA